MHLLNETSVVGRSVLHPPMVVSFLAIRLARGYCNFNRRSKSVDTLEASNPLSTTFRTFSICYDDARSVTCGDKTFGTKSSLLSACSCTSWEQRSLAMAPA